MSFRRIKLILSCVLILGMIGCSNTEGEKGSYIVNKEGNSILVAFGIYQFDVSRPVIKLKEEGVNLMYYIVEDSELLESLKIGERVTAQAFQDENGHTMIMYSDPPQVRLGKIIRHSVGDEEWVHP